jgi:hypothetical protein
MILRPSLRTIGFGNFEVHVMASAYTTSWVASESLWRSLVTSANSGTGIFRPEAAAEIARARDSNDLGSRLPPAHMSAALRVAPHLGAEQNLDSRGSAQSFYLLRPSRASEIGAPMIKTTSATCLPSPGRMRMLCNAGASGGGLTSKSRTRDSVEPNIHSALLLVVFGIAALVAFRKLRLRASWRTKFTILVSLFCILRSCGLFGSDASFSSISLNSSSISPRFACK